MISFEVLAVDERYRNIGEMLETQSIAGIQRLTVEVSSGQILRHWNHLPV